MPLHSWWTFVIATFLICGTPGPNMLHMMASGIRYGLRRAFPTMAGCMLAVLSITFASVAGIGALLKASPHLFDGLRLAGAAYLIYLGIRSFCKSAPAPVDTEITIEVAADATPKTLFLRGLMVGLSNPKLFLFATAFFPQFIDESLPQAKQLIILLSTGFCLEFGWYIAYAAGGSRIAGYMQDTRRQKQMQHIIGVLFIAFGALLLLSHI